MWQGLFLKKVAGWLWHRCFPVNFAKFSGTTFLQSTSERLLLKHKQTISKVFMRLIMSQNISCFS